MATFDALLQAVESYTHSTTPEQKSQHQEAITKEAVALLSELRYLSQKWIVKTIDAIDLEANGLQPITDDDTMERLVAQIDESLSLWEYIEAAALDLNLPYQTDNEQSPSAANLD